MTFIICHEPEEQTFPVSLLATNALQFAAPASNTTFGAYDDGTIKKGAINDVSEDGYGVLRPIPYSITRTDDGDFEAVIRPANIAINGTDRQDAYQALVAELLDTFDTLRTEQNLSAVATAQLAILNTYLVKTADGE